MNSKIRFRFVAVIGALLAGVVVSLSSGCLAVAAGAGAGATVAYVRGDLDTTLGATLDRSDFAANEAIKQLQFAKISENRDALQIVIIARNATDRKIELHLQRLADDATKLKIRVGTFGDDQLQTTILEKVRQNL